MGVKQKKHENFNGDLKISETKKEKCLQSECASQLFFVV